MTAVGKTLEERGKRYGNYLDQTSISNKIKEAMQEIPTYWDMETDQKDALEMIAVKISRIINGDPDYADNWTDIAGYATLVAERLDGVDRGDTGLRGIRGPIDTDWPS